MSRTNYEDRLVFKARHKAYQLLGELIQETRASFRGKGINETRKDTFVAIFTFDSPLICSESEVPLRGGYFLTEDGQAEVTQLIGRFESQLERNNWITENIEVINGAST